MQVLGQSCQDFLEGCLAAYVSYSCYRYLYWYIIQKHMQSRSSVHKCTRCKEEERLGDVTHLTRILIAAEIADFKTLDLTAFPAEQPQTYRNLTQVSPAAFGSVKEQARITLPSENMSTLSESVEIQFQVPIDMISNVLRISQIPTTTSIQKVKVQTFTNIITKKEVPKLQGTVGFRNQTKSSGHAPCRAARPLTFATRFKINRLEAFSSPRSHSCWIHMVLPLPNGFNGL